MLAIYRVDHIGQVVPELEPQLEFLESVFGFRPLRTFESLDDGCRGARLAVGGPGGEDWVVLAPLGQDSPFQAFMDAQGGRPGLHHIAVEVPDIAAAHAELTGRRIEPVAESPGQWIEASLSPPDHGTGVLFRINGTGDHTLLGEDPKAPLDGRTPSGDTPNLGIVGVDHVCQAFGDRDALASWYEDLAGFLQVWRTPIDEHPDMADLVMNIPGSRLCWEIIMPRGEDSFIERFLERSGPAAHHVTLEVGDWDVAMRALEHHGIEPFGSNSGETDGAAWRDAFLHPKQTGGILVQLFWEQRPGVWVRSDKIPPQR